MEKLEAREGGGEKEVKGNRNEAGSKFVDDFLDSKVFDSWTVGIIGLI